MTPRTGWIYTREGDRWIVLDSGILRLEEAPRLSWLRRVINVIRRFFFCVGV